MQTYVALLRGINVGGKHIVPMQAFREILARLGCERVAVAESAFYLYAHSGIGRSKFAADVEKCLGVKGTARNARTLAKITALIAACD